MMQKNGIGFEVDLKELFYLLLHKLWLIILVAIFGAVLSAAYSEYLITPFYASTAKLYIINREYGEDVVTWSDVQTGAILAQDFRILVKSRPVMEEVIQKLNLDMSSEELTGLVSVDIPTDSRVMDITVFHWDYQMAKEIVDAVSEVSSQRLVDVMGMDRVTIVEEGDIPFYPSSPNVMQNTILGGFFGAVITSFIILLVYILNDSIKTAEDVEKYLGITTLGIIPIENGTNKKKYKIRQSKSKAAIAS